MNKIHHIFWYAVKKFLYLIFVGTFLFRKAEGRSEVIKDHKRHAKT